MVKTRSDLKGVRISTKAPRKMPVSSTSSSSGKSSKKYNGTNSYCPREVPSWQKEITKFFSPEENNKNLNDEMPCSSGETSHSQSHQSS